MDPNTLGQNNVGQGQDLPGSLPVGQFPVAPAPVERSTAQNGPLGSDSLRQYASKPKAPKLPDHDKKLAIFIVIAFIVIIIVVVTGIIYVFSGIGGSGGSDVATIKEMSNSAADITTSVQEPPKIAPVAGVYKDSILKSVDSGKNFETYFWIATTTELKVVDVLNITFYPDVKDKIIVSSYDDGLFLNENGVNQWELIPFPPQKIYSFIVDRVDPDNRAFVSGVVSKNGRIFRTEDGGVTWRAVYAEPGDNTYVSSLTQDPRNHEVILAGTSAGTLVRSVDGGDTWKNIGQKISGNISRFAHDSIRNSFMYLLVSGGKIYHSYDGGVTWIDWEDVKVEEIKDLNTRAGDLSRFGNRDGAQAVRDQVAALQQKNREEMRPSGIIYIVADPNRSGVLYAGLSRGLYRSEDYGKYWEKVNIIESAEQFPIASIAINPKDSDEISFVSGNSFYRSVNYGSTWAVTPLDKTRNASFVAYDPFDPMVVFVGLSAKK